jgi:hypothetical protein
MPAGPAEFLIVGRGLRDLLYFGNVRSSFESEQVLLASRGCKIGLLREWAEGISTRMKTRR